MNLFLSFSQSRAKAKTRQDKRCACVINTLSFDTIFFNLLTKKGITGWTKQRMESYSAVCTTFH